MANVSRWLCLALTLAGCNATPGRQQMVSDGMAADLSASDDTCAGPADCMPGQACDGATHKCSDHCAATEPCNGGCCLNGVCSAGQITTACGVSGAACVDCSASSPGLLRSSSRCGS